MRLLIVALLHLVPKNVLVLCIFTDVYNSEVYSCNGLALLLSLCLIAVAVTIAYIFYVYTYIVYQHFNVKSQVKRVFGCIRMALTT